MLIEIAPAKINFTLEVICKRDDGFHEIKSLMQTIDICDVLTFWENSSIHVFPEYGNLPPADGFYKNKSMHYIGDNLVYKAAELLKKETGYKGGAIIQLKKNIPSAMGLGGGSSDAAATLKGLNKLWGLGLSIKELSSLAATLGSDVTFFLHGGTCLATGRGEKIEKIRPLPEKWILLLSPPVMIENKTKKLYSLVNRTHYTSGDKTKDLYELIKFNGQGSKGKDTGLKNEDLFNVFESVYRNGNGIFDDWKSCIRRVGIDSLHLAGSGPTVFCLAERRERLVKLLESQKDVCKNMATYIVRTISDY